MWSNTDKAASLSSSTPSTLKSDRLITVRFYHAVEPQWGYVSQFCRFCWGYSDYTLPAKTQLREAGWCVGWSREYTDCCFVVQSECIATGLLFTARPESKSTWKVFSSWHGFCLNDSIWRAKGDCRSHGVWTAGSGDQHSCGHKPRVCFLAWHFSSASNPSDPPPMPCAKSTNAAEWILIFKQRGTSEASSLAENKITRYFALKQNVTRWRAKQVGSAAGNVCFPLDKSLLRPEGKEAVSRNARALCLNKPHLLR